jgi:hypothetical protein
LAVADLIGLVREDTLAIRAAVADVGTDVVVAATRTLLAPLDRLIVPLAG